MKARTDIQVLRGFAVLAVVFYHAGFGFFSAGYLGVDVFFVISGFLISRLIRDGIDEGRFSFTEFYFRRAKRLLPAAYVTFLVTALLTPFFLAPAELVDFRDQLLGALTFTANIVLWKQSGYFGGEADLKPLLHVWSLAIEEQYYFVLPAVMVLLPRRHWLRGAIVVLIVSLVLCFLRAGRESTFYLIPTRAWELAIGSFGTLLAIGPRVRKWLVGGFWPAMSAMIGLCSYQVGRHHPGIDALLVCAATLVVILRAHPILQSGLAVRGVAKVGDISYSLYLVHWPIFAFLQNTWLGADARPSIALRAALILISFVLALLLNRFVEEPLRRLPIRRRGRAVAGTLAISLSIVGVAVAAASSSAGKFDGVATVRSNLGFGADCDFHRDFEAVPACRDSDRPATLVWGDSFAMHLIPGLTAGGSGVPGVVQATQSLCGPLGLPADP